MSQQDLTTAAAALFWGVVLTVPFVWIMNKLVGSERYEVGNDEISRGAAARRWAIRTEDVDDAEVLLLPVLFWREVMSRTRAKTVGRKLLWRSVVLHMRDGSRHVLTPDNPAQLADTINTVIRRRTLAELHGYSAVASSDRKAADGAT